MLFDNKVSCADFTDTLSPPQIAVILTAVCSVTNMAYIEKKTKCRARNNESL